MSDVKENRTILKCLVGSCAHGLDTPESDKDYRSVFLASTSTLLQLGPKPKTTDWIEGDVDNTSWELGHFLFLASKSNPSILEVLVSPVVATTPIGSELRDLLLALWSKDNVLNAFRGYGHNQRKKFLENKDERPWKYATAYARVLLLGIELLQFGTMTVNLDEQTKVLQRLEGNPWLWPDLPGIDPGVSGSDGYYYEGLTNALRDIKGGKWSRGQLIDWVTKLEDALVSCHDQCKHEQDLDKVNEFLLRVRKENWS